METKTVTNEWPIGATVVTIEDLGGTISNAHFEGDVLVQPQYGVVVPAGTRGQVVDHFEDGRILCDFPGHNGGHSFREPGTFLRLVAPKPQDEIERLKASWAYDPIWDIEETEGFEAHYDELLAYHQKMKKEWDREYQQQLEQKAKELGVPGNTKLAQQFINLENKIKQLEGVVENIYFRD